MTYLFLLQLQYILSLYRSHIYIYNSTFRDLIKKYIFHPCFYGDVLNQAQKFKYDTSKFAKPFYNIIPKYLTTIVHSLRQVYFANNIDNTSTTR